jgi:ankyrin repeat protein
MTSPPPASPIPEKTWLLLEKAGWPENRRVERHPRFGTPLMYAIEHMGAGSFWRAPVELLAARGVELDRTFKRDGRTTSALLFAVEAGDRDVVEILLRHGANPNMAKGLATPLQIAATAHNALMIRQTTRPQGLFMKNPQAATQMMMQADRESLGLGQTSGTSQPEGTYPDIAGLLLAAGAEVDKTLHNHPTALGLTRQPAMMKVLLDAGANPELPDREMPTCLLGLAQNAWQTHWDLAPFEVLLSGGANVFAVGIQNRGVLHMLARSSFSRTDSVEATTAAVSPLLTLLLDAGADINGRDICGCTPLMLAAVHHPQLIPAFLALGADPTLTSHTGETAIGLIEARPHSISIGSHEKPLIHEMGMALKNARDRQYLEQTLAPGISRPVAGPRNRI